MTMARAVFFFLMSFFLVAHADIHEEAPIIIRGPSAEDGPVKMDARARISRIVDTRTLKATSYDSDWVIGEVVAVESQMPAAGIVSFVEVTGIENKQDGTFEITCQLLRQSRLHFVQVGDELMHLDLSSDNERYRGTTDLIVKQQTKEISAKYKPLFLQGVSVGETAQTLWEKEFLITFLGQVHYGINPWLTVNTLVPANFFGAANAAFKAELYDSVANTVSAGLSYAKIPNDTASALNLNIYWDSISSDTTLSHTFLSIALYSFDRAEDTTIIKSLGTSSLQTGYEFILGHWDRVLLGPSYNFQKKTIGAYISYVKIWDRFHLSAGVTTSDLTSLKIDAQDGYVPTLEAYWRF